MAQLVKHNWQKRELSIIQEHLTEEEILAVIRSHFGSQVRVTRFISPRQGYMSLTYLLQLNTHPQWVVLKAAPRWIEKVGADQFSQLIPAESFGIQLVGGRLPVSVPKVHRCDLSGRVIDRDYILLERLPGWTVFDKKVTIDGSDMQHLRGESLRVIDALHGVSYPLFGTLGNHKLVKKCSSWRDFFIWHAAGNIKCLQDAGVFDDQSGQCLEEAFQRASDILVEPEHPSFIHGHVLSHLLFEGEGTQSHPTGLVDFADSFFGHPEFEYEKGWIAGERRPGAGYESRKALYDIGAVLQQLRATLIFGGRGRPEWQKKLSDFAERNGERGLG